MIEGQKPMKESRPMSANCPLERVKNNRRHSKTSEYLLSEKENEQLNKLTRKQKEINNLLNSPFRKEMKDILNTINSKNLFSEIKEHRTKTHLPKIQSSTASTVSKNQTKIIKLGIIDAKRGNNKLKYNIKDDSENNDPYAKDKKSETYININVGRHKKKMEINCQIKEIQNKNKNNNNSICDSNNHSKLDEDNEKLFLLTEQNKDKEKAKLNNIGFRKNSFFKNNKSNDKQYINIKPKKEKELIIDDKKIKNEIINNCNINNDENEENNNNINGINKIVQDINNKIKEQQNNDKKINKNNNLENNKEGNNIKIFEVDKNEENNFEENINKNCNDKFVKFNKEISIINIMKDNKDAIENNRNNINSINKENGRNINNENFEKKEEKTINNINNINNITNNITNDTSNINITNYAGLENQNLINEKSNINLSNANQNIILNENKYNNYDMKQTVKSVKSSANSNKNLSEISEHINSNLSASKLDHSQEDNNKPNGESSSDKNCGLILSLSNNIETDGFLHKIITCKNKAIYLGEVINESSKSVIYKGLDTNIGELICVKRYVDKNNSEEFQREIDIYDLIQILENENIIKCYGFKNDDEGNFIFLEHANGDSLKKIIKLYGGSLNEKIIRNYTKQILNALLYLHTNVKAAHRDIKCDNILLDKNGIIKLIDFGCAGILNKPYNNNDENNKKEIKDPNKPFQGFKGSWPWCAPEVLKNEFYGTKCDIWSLGCTIIEMGGMEPWNNTLKSFYQFIDTVGNKEDLPEIPKQFSYELRDFVLNCLVKDPDKRADVNTLLNHFFITGTKLDNKTVLIT